MDFNGLVVIVFIQYKWNLPKNTIAQYLGCHATKLSRETFRYRPKELYEKIFDIDNKKSLASENNEDVADLLKGLKSFLEKEGFKNDLADIWDIDESKNKTGIFGADKQEKLDIIKAHYKAFVMEFLCRANKPPIKSKSTKGRKNVSISEKVENVAICENEMTSEQILQPQEVNISAHDYSDNEQLITDSSNSTGTHQSQNVGAQLSVDGKYKRCLFCTKWDGNATYAYKVPSGVYGVCVMDSSKQLSTEGANCKNYEPNYSRITYNRLRPDI